MVWVPKSPTIDIVAIESSSALAVLMSTTMEHGDDASSKAAVQVFHGPAFKVEGLAC